VRRKRRSWKCAHSWRSVGKPHELEVRVPRPWVVMVQDYRCISCDELDVQVVPWLSVSSR
jgi:hypothetical protein